MSQRRIGVACMACVVVIAFFATAAAAKIFVGQGMAGVKLGDTPTRTRSVLGKPTQVLNRVKGEAEFYYYDNGKIASAAYTMIQFINNRAVAVTTTSPKQKTDKGVGPGSSLSKVKRTYPAAACKTFPFGAVQCDLHTRRHGRKVTTGFMFLSPKQGLHEVEIGY